MQQAASYIMMLEEDPDDRFLTEAVLSSAGLTIPITYLTYSTEISAQVEQQKPGLIIIDYNSHPNNAAEILKQLKSSPVTSDIPVVVLSDSSSDRFKAECYRLGASSFIIKPTTYEESRKKITCFFDYWLNVTGI